MARGSSSLPFPTIDLRPPVPRQEHPTLKLKIEREPIEPRQVKLTVEVDAARLTSVMEGVARELSKKYKVPGFRPGKAPLKRMAAVVGEEPILEQALEQLGRQAMAEAMQSEGTLPAAPVEVRVKQESPPIFEAVIPLEPEVDLGDYRALRMEREEPAEVVEADIDELFDRLRGDLAELVPVRRPAEAEDVVTLSLEARRAVALTGDDAPVRQHDELHMALTEEGEAAARLPPGFADEIIGLAPGQTHIFTLTLPEDWPEEALRGRPLRYEVQVAEVSTVELPEMDDELARKVSDEPDLASLRERAREDLALRRRNQAREGYLEGVLDALVARARIDYPPALLEHETRDLAADLRARVERQGFDWKRWLELQEKTEDQLWEELIADAERRLLRGLVMQRFVDLEGLHLEESELDAEMTRLEELVSSMPRNQRPDLEALRRDTGNRMLTGRAIERLLAIASGEAGESSEDEGEDPAAESDPDPAKAAASAAATQSEETE